MERIFAKFPGGGKASLAEMAFALLEGQKTAWPELREGYAALAVCRERRVQAGNMSVILQFNPRRVKSAGADIDPDAVKKRPCFLCRANLPDLQQAIVYREKYLVLCNPFPIFPRHFTIAHIDHVPQALSGALPSLLRLARDFHPELALLYNGPRCGASAPDHLHFQALPRAAIPALQDGLMAGKKALKRAASGLSIFQTINSEPPAIIVEGNDEQALVASIRRMIKAMIRLLSPAGEPMLNLFCLYAGGTWQVIIFPRQKHRPAVYYEAGKGRVLVSPGAVDMGGLLVLPRKEDYCRIDAALLSDIYREVSLPEAWIDRITAAIFFGGHDPHFLRKYGHVLQ